MKRRWMASLLALALIIVLAWGAGLSFATPFSCDWPTLEELVAKPNPASWSADSPLAPELVGELEIVVAKAILQQGSSSFRVDPDSDFIQHSMPSSPRSWRYASGQLISVDQKVVTRVFRNINWEAYGAVGHPKLFRFAILDAGRNHACVLLEQTTFGSHSFGLWYFFRSGFGLGSWWWLPPAGIFYGY